MSFSFRQSPIIISTNLQSSSTKLIGVFIRKCQTFTWDIAIIFFRIPLFLFISLRSSIDNLSTSNCRSPHEENFFIWRTWYYFCKYIISFNLCDWVRIWNCHNSNTIVCWIFIICICKCIDIWINIRDNLSRRICWRNWRIQQNHICNARHKSSCRPPIRYVSVNITLINSSFSQFTSNASKFQTNSSTNRQISFHSNTIDEGISSHLSNKSAIRIWFVVFF